VITLLPALICCAGAGRAATTSVGAKVVATLGPGAVLGPKPVGAVGSARGTFEEVVDRTTATAVWKLSYGGTTGTVIDARVVYHFDTLVRGVLVGTQANDDLCSPCLQHTSGTIHFPRPSDATTFLKAVHDGRAQVVLFTARNAKQGEIAGDLKTAGTAAVTQTHTTPTAATASASYTDGRIRLTVTVGQPATAQLIISDRGKPPFSPAPIHLRPGTNTVVLTHRFLTRGYHAGIVNLTFAGSSRTLSVSVAVP
jgi:hypothetical protein